MSQSQKNALQLPTTVDSFEESRINSRFFATALATLIGLGLSTPAVAQSVDAGQNTVSKDAKPVSEWRLKPRARVQYDVANIDGPDGLAGTGDFNKVRRARIGADLTMPDGFSARVEWELTGSPNERTDAYLQWNDKNVKFMLGQQKAQLPLDEETSNLNISFLERAAFVSAFGYSRRTGLSGHYVTGDLGISGGIYTDTISQLDDVEKGSTSVDVRAHWSPKLENTKLHFGAAYHWRDLNDFELEGTRYRSRPALGITDTRYIATPELAVEKEQRFGLEAAAVRGRFHIVGETHWLKAATNGVDDSTFFGTYAEVGVFLTKDSRPLKGGAFGAIAPRKPLGEGGLGAVQLNLRYDYLDLNSGAVTGGKQNGYLASLIWTPAKNFRLMAEYAKLDYTDAAIAVDGNRAYTVNMIGVRGQISY